MRNIIKKLSSGLAVMAMSGMVAMTTMAGDVSVCAGDPGLSGKNYIVKTKASNPEITFRHIAQNNSNTNDQVQYEVSRTMRYTGTLSGSLEADAVVYKVKTASEVGYGEEIKVSTTCTWTIEPHKTTTCCYGSMVLSTSGTMETWNNGRLVSSKAVSAKYTTASYSDKIAN